MKNVCFVVEELQSIGGLQKITILIANALSQDNQYDVTILLTTRGESINKIPYEISPSIKVVSNKNISRGKFEFIPHKIATLINLKYFKVRNTNILKKILFPKEEIARFQQFFDKGKFDYVIGVAPRNSAIVSLMSLQGKKIGWLHNTIERYFFLKKMSYWNQLEVYKILLPKLDNLIVLTDQASENYKETLKISPTRIYNPLTFTTEEKSCLNSNSILFIGRLDNETKGLDLLLESLKILKKRNLNFMVDIVGEGPYYGKLKEEIIRNNLIDNVHLHGFTKDVQDFYLKNSLLVVPSRVEGFGLVVTEAMEAGLPVISYETEGPTEIIDNGIDGFLIKKYDYEEFANKIEKLLSDEHLRVEMGKAAALKAKQFSMKDIIEIWKELLS